MTSSRKYLLLIALSLLLPVPLLGSSSVRITTDMQDGKAEVGEKFRITIEAINTTGKLEVNQVPPGVKILYNSTSSSTASSTVNGRTEKRNSTSLVLTCKAEKPGNYKFGPVAVDGVRSNVLSYQIEPASGKPRQQQPTNTSSNSYDPNSGPLFIGKGNEEMFLRAHVNKTKVYEQEAVEYTVKLYTTYGEIKFLGAAAAPKFDGFVVEESDDVSHSFSFEDFKGKTYKTAIIARYIIFPQKSGSLKVAGNTYTVSTDAKQYYHDPYFQTMTVKYPVQLNVTPNDVDIEVKALPTPIPDNFIGGVGKFTITSSLPSATMITNSVSSIIFQISGTGNIKYVKLPDIAPSFPASFELYTPEVSTDVKVGSSNVSGTAKFDYSIVPRETGIFTLPALTFTYFDPEEGTYKRLDTHSYNVSVRMGQSSAKSQQTFTFNPALMPIGKISFTVGQPYVSSLLYWLWYLVPVIIFALSLTLYRKYLRDHEDMTLLRSKKASKMALKRLAKAYQCFKNKQEEQFYDEMLAALWGYIGDKLKMPTSELNRRNVSEEFKTHGVKESTFMPILNLIDECEYAKYTPVSRNANMRQLYYDALESLQQVEKEYDKETGQKPEEDDDLETDTAPDTGSAAYVNTSSIGSADQRKDESGGSNPQNSESHEE
ncbi:MAG: protein BatD [Muribaculaceae bacterium]|nr:protein BatD [Muribaculaceae bacterium]